MISCLSLVQERGTRGGTVGSLIPWSCGTPLAYHAGDRFGPRVRGCAATLGCEYHRFAVEQKVGGRPRCLARFWWCFHHLAGGATSIISVFRTSECDQRPSRRQDIHRLDSQELVQKTIQVRGSDRSPTLIIEAMRIEDRPA